MAQNGVADVETRRASDLGGGAAKAVSNGASKPATATNALQGANADLLLNMMNCVDTSLFSPQQLHSWEQMKQRIKAAAEQNVPLVVPAGVSERLVKASAAANGGAVADNGASGGGGNVDFRQPLHREASIQDVLSCLLDQQPPSLRLMASSGGNMLLNSEMKNRGATQTDETRPTLKSLLSSNDFTMTEKKESLKHLLSFIDNSFASHPEPMTDVYKESQDGNLRRLSSLHLMRSFLTPNTNAQSMGRTTSFEIIQSMLNATSNQTIQKPMTSQDSFRFQHLANVLESIEGDVGYDNEDYGGEEVVQVDNLDNLLDYQSPTHAAQSHQQAAQTGGFVDTQSIVNQASRLGASAATAAASGGTTAFGNDYASANVSAYQNYGQQLYGATTQYGHHQSSVDMIGNTTPHAGAHAGMMYPPVKVEPTTPHHQQAATMLPPAMLPQPSPFAGMSYQSAMLGAGSDLLMGGGTPSAAAYHTAQIKPTSLQHQQFSAMLQQQMQQQQQQLQQQQHLAHHHSQQHAHHAHSPAAILQSSSHGKQQKQEAQGGVQICSALGCNHAARVKGMCKLHGGGRRCKVEGCMKSAQTGHLCIAHGGGKPCNVEGCPKTAQSRGLCKQHGGGVRCKFEGCTKSCQSGGYCRGHGGGKRCEYPNCAKWAQKNGHCAKHAQEVTAAQVHP